MSNKPHISIVSPVYKAANILDKLVDEIQKVMLQMNLTYEIVLVDDRSPDNSWEVMQQLSAKFPPLNLCWIAGDKFCEPFANPCVTNGL